MKNYIFDYDQKTAMEIGLTVDDLLLLRWFVDFKECGKMEKKYIKDVNDMGYWVSYNKIINDLPIIFNGKTMESNKKKIQRMLNGNLKKVITREFERATEKNGGKIYLSLVAENYYKLVSGIQENQDINTYGQKCPEGIDKNVQRGIDNNVQSDSPIYNSPIYNNRTEQNSIDIYNNIVNKDKTKTELNCSELSDEDKNINLKNPVIIPQELEENFDKFFIKRLRMERSLFGLNFNDDRLYNTFADALVKTQIQDNIEILTTKQYAYFIETIQRMLKVLRL